MSSQEPNQQYALEESDSAHISYVEKELANDLAIETTLTDQQRESNATKQDLSAGPHEKFGSGDGSMSGVAGNISNSNSIDEANHRIQLLQLLHKINQGIAHYQQVSPHPS
jgi:hypothetical protein